MKDLIENALIFLSTAIVSGVIGDKGWWRAVIRFSIRRWQRKNKANP